MGVGAAVVGTTLPPASVDAEEDVPQLLGEIVEVVAPARTILLSVSINVSVKPVNPRALRGLSFAEAWGCAVISPRSC